MQNKPKQTQFKLEAQRRPLRASFLESSNQRPSKACPERSPEYVEGRSRMGQFQKGYLQRSSQCYRPAGGNNNYKRQNYVSDFNLSKKTLQKPEIHPKNSYKEPQKCCDNQHTAKKTGSRLDIKCFEDSALSKNKCCSGHSAGRTRQAVFLLEPAGAKPPAHIYFVTSCHPEKTEESNDCQANNRPCKTLTKRCTAENFQLIYLLACLHKYIKIE